MAKREKNSCYRVFLFVVFFQKSCYRVFLLNKFALTWFFAEFDQAVHQLREAGIQVRSSWDTWVISYKWHTWWYHTNGTPGIQVILSCMQMTHLCDVMQMAHWYPGDIIRHANDTTLNNRWRCLRIPNIPSNQVKTCHQNYHDNLPAIPFLIGRFEPLP